MGTQKIIYWIATLLLFALEGIIPVITYQSEAATESIRHLGYPDYFGVMLTVFKVVGALVIVIPRIPPLLKEFAYAGFAIDFIAAFVSIWAVDGLVSLTFFPLFAFILLAVSYYYYHKIFIAVESELVD